MSSVNAPFGLRVAHSPNGIIRPTAYAAIASGYPSNIYQGTPVTITGGKLAVATAGAGNRIAGVFQGVEYTDTNNKPNYSSYWPAGQTTLNGVDAKAYIILDPYVVYEIQANGSVAQTQVGSQAAFASGVGNGNLLPGGLGVSTATLDTATISNSTANQLRIIGITPGADNVFGDAYTIVQVQIAQHVNVANQNPY
jgi:hypothetical protein